MSICLVGVEGALVLWLLLPWDTWDSVTENLMSYKIYPYVETSYQVEPIIQERCSSQLVTPRGTWHLALGIQYQRVQVTGYVVSGHVVRQLSVPGTGWRYSFLLEVGV